MLSLIYTDIISQFYFKYYYEVLIIQLKANLFFFISFFFSFWEHNLDYGNVVWH